MVGIRRIGPGEWEVFRDVRLRALADAPYAFGSRLADERDRPERAWRERLDAPDAAAFVALDGERGVGVVRVSLVTNDSARAEILSMWVDPDHRGRGVGDGLLAAAVAWARDRAVRTLELWVTETNAPARRLYQRHGFVATGERQPLPSDPTMWEIAMESAVAVRAG